MMCVLALYVNAQDLLAFHIVGGVKYMKGDRMVPLVMNTRVPANTIISIPLNGKAEFVDESNSRRITISSPGNGAINTIAKEQGNSIISLTGRYIEYVKRQMTNKALTSKQRYTDFATVTRQFNVNGIEKGIDGEDKISNKEQNSSETFRDKCNAQYNFFIRQPWKLYNASLDIQTDDLNTTDELLHNVKSQIFDVEDMKEASSVKGDMYFNKMPIIFRDVESEVRIDESLRFNLGNINPDRIADALTYLSSKQFDKLLYDCLDIRRLRELDDMGYLMFSKTVSDQFCGEGSSEASLLCGWLLCQSGYKIRYAYDTNNHLYLFIACKKTFNDISCHFKIDGVSFYSLENTPHELFFSQAAFEKETVMSSNF